jgi:OFA family oxalate/formate antiporter-like MFS transporter
VALDAGVSESDTHLVFVVMVIVMGIASAISGRILKIGLKYSIFLSILLFVTGTFMTSLGLLMHVFHPVVIGYGIISAIGLGFLYLIPISNVMRWFPKHEGLAVGWTILGFGLSSIVSSPILSLIYDSDTFILVMYQPLSRVKIVLTSFLKCI